MSPMTSQMPSRTTMPMQTRPMMDIPQPPPPPVSLPPRVGAVDVEVFRRASGAEARPAPLAHGAAAVGASEAASGVRIGTGRGSVDMGTLLHNGSAAQGGGPTPLLPLSQGRAYPNRAGAGRGTARAHLPALAFRADSTKSMPP